MLTSLINRFIRDRRGNVVILFALTLIPMIGLTGLAIDYAMALRAKTVLDASTDSAVLAAATEATQIIQSQSSPNYDPTDVAIYYGTIAGQNVFQANSAMVMTTTTPTLTLALQHAKNSLIVTATGSYTAAWPTYFGKMFGTATMNIAGKAASALNLPKFMNIYVATDVSQSMGIAATQTDMSHLSALTGGCVFGCHVTAPGQSVTNEQVAHTHNISLRIDVIKTAIQNMIASAQSLTNGTPTISFGLYTLQERIPADNTNYYNVISSPSTNYANLTTLANQIDLGNNDSSGVGDSDFSNSVTQLANAEVGTSGDGSSNSSKQNFVFLMTDGVADIKGGCTDGHCTKAFDPALCDSLKSKGVTVGVIYTTYIPFTNEQTYMDLVYPFQSQIAPNLQKCASPGYYYEATDGPAIQSAMNALFAQAVSAGKLTQ